MIPAVLFFFIGITLGEVLTTRANPMIGLGLHGLMLLMLIVQGAVSRRRVAQRFYLSLALVPLIRLISLSLPLSDYPFIYWYMLIGAPLFLAAFFTARMAGVNIDRLLFNRNRLWLQGLVALSGVLLGYVEYLILRPQPLVAEFSFRSVWQPALILLIFTGLLEEVIFRGLLQPTAREAIGSWGLVYAALLFAVMHLGYQSLTDFLFVLAVALFFGLVVLRTSSILGVTLAHGLTNIGLFLVFPFLAAASPLPLPDWLPMPPPATLVYTVTLPSTTATLQPTITATPLPSRTATATSRVGSPQPRQNTPTVLAAATTTPTPTPDWSMYAFPQGLPMADVWVPNAFLIMVDDGDHGFVRSGGTTWLSAYGIGGDLVWASPVFGEADALVEWLPALPSAGRYEVQVFCPHEFATFRSARYEVGTPSGIFPVILDQAEHQGKWASLGVYAFEPDGQAFLRLSNLATENPGANELVGFDAARWVLLPGDE